MCDVCPSAYHHFRRHWKRSALRSGICTARKGISGPGCAPICTQVHMQAASRMAENLTASLHSKEKGGGRGAWHSTIEGICTIHPLGTRVTQRWRRRRWRRRRRRPRRRRVGHVFVCEASQPCARGQLLATRTESGNTYRSILLLTHTSCRRARGTGHRPAQILIPRRL